MNKAQKLIELAGESIGTDTPILPDVIANTILDRVIGYLHEQGKDKEADAMVAKKEEYAMRLTSRAEKLYHDPKYKKKIQGGGNKGRDFLYSFMQHWIDSYLRMDMGIALPQDFALGKGPELK